MSRGHTYNEWFDILENLRTEPDLIEKIYTIKAYLEEGLSVYLRIPQTNQMFIEWYYAYYSNIPPQVIITALPAMGVICRNKLYLTPDGYEFKFKDNNLSDKYIKLIISYYFEGVIADYKWNCIIKYNKTTIPFQISYNFFHVLIYENTSQNEINIIYEVLRHVFTCFELLFLN